MDIFTKLPIRINVVNTQLEVEQQYIWANKNKKAFIRKKYGGDEVDELLDSFDDLEELLEKEEKPKIIKKISRDKFNIVEDIHLFAEDKVSDLKKKIYITTGIPPYRQHLWYIFSGKSFPLSYVLNIPYRFNPDIRDIKKETTFIESIPVNTSWYSNKDNIMVSAFDDFQLLGQIYNKHRITDFFVADLNSFIDPVRENIKKIIKTDSYTAELIYYSFIIKYWPQLSLSLFSLYIKNESVIEEKYPDLYPNADILNRYVLETKLMNEPIKTLKMPIYTSITHNVLSVNEKYIVHGTFIQLRNLFDLMRLDDFIHKISCNIDYKGNKVQFTKIKKNKSFSVLHNPINTIMFIINPPNGIMNFTLYEKGIYKVESSWREDQHFGFEDIYTLTEKYINRIIKIINKWEGSILSNKLPLISKSNTLFSKLNISMFLKSTMSMKSFSILKQKLGDYVDANILNLKEDLEYFFIKGMYDYSLGKYKMITQLQNEYDYLTDSSVKNKYMANTIKTKKMIISNRFSDVKIQVTNLKQHEFSTFYKHIMRLMSNIKWESKVMTSSNTKKLKNLKEKDPILFDIKKIYKTKKLYSRLCQLKNQPLIHNEPGKNRVAYWNFTDNSPAYYSCPNPKYPYLNFMTNVHPENYCMPCCYKLPVSKNPKDKKRIIYDLCIKNKKYEKEKKNITKSPYVMSYGKNLLTGRLSRLPSKTLEPLFYNTFSLEKTGIDEECMSRVGYYLFGVVQNVRNVSNIGFIFSLAHALEMNIIMLISLLIKKIENASEYWYTLLNGEILNYFGTLKDFLDELKNVFIGNKLSNFNYWNLVFMDLTKIYLSVKIIHFVDMGSGIKINIPKFITNIDDYKSKNKHLIVLQKDVLFYPIYLVDNTAIMKLGIIKNRLFEADSYIIREIYNLANYHIQKNYKDGLIDLPKVKKVIKKSNYNITHLLINSINNCYGVLVKKITPTQLKEKLKIKDESWEDSVSLFNSQNKENKNKEFYIPISLSYNKKDGTHITFETIKNKHLPELKQLLEFIKPFEIKIKAWLKFNGKIIGFRTTQLQYLCITTTIAIAQKKIKLPMIEMLYHPIEINKKIKEKSPAIMDLRSKNLNKSLYFTYLYNILILEFINILRKERNVNLRKKIKTIINSKKNTRKKNLELSILLKNYPNDFLSIAKMITKLTSKKQLMELINMFDENIFDFDYVMLEKMKKMNNKELRKKLKDIFKKVVINKTPKFDKEFANMLTSCNTKTEEPMYCLNNKLMVPNNKLDEYIEVLTEDILNPLKSKYMFSPVFRVNTIDYFKFIVREEESIFITI